MSGLRWTCKGVRPLAEARQERGHTVSYPVVAELMAEAGHRLPGNQKTEEGSRHPDRDAPEKREPAARVVPRTTAQRRG